MKKLDVLATALIVALVSAASPACADAGSATRPYSVEDMLKNEDLGEVRFDPTGRMLAVEKYAPYADDTDYALTVLDKSRARLSVADVSAKSGLDLLQIGSASNVNYGEFSPDGRKIAVWWREGLQIKTGVYDFDTHALRRFDIVPTLAHALNKYPLWISNDELIYQTTTPSNQLALLAHDRGAHERATEWAKMSWAGKEAAVTVLENGDAPPALPAGYEQTNGLDTIVRVDARTGAVTELGKGFEFTIFHASPVSPDGRYFAMTRQAGVVPQAERSKQFYMYSNRRFELVIFDLKHNAVAQVIGAPGFNVHYVFAWSPSGRKLLYATHRTRDGKTSVSYHVHDLASGKDETLAAKDVEFRSPEVRPGDSWLTPPTGWVGETPMVLAKPKGAAATDRYDWYAIARGKKSVNLTAKLPEEPKGYVANHGNGVLVMSGGELWRISQHGRAESLTETIAPKVLPWCVTFSVWLGNTSECDAAAEKNEQLPVDRAALEADLLALQTLENALPSGVLFLDLKRGTSVPVQGFEAGDKLVAVSALTRSAVVRRNGRDGDRLMLLETNKPARELWHFNRHFAGLDVMQRVVLTRNSAVAKTKPGEELVDWLLLPPGYEPGQRLPLVVYFYPDRRYSREQPWQVDDIRSTSFLNQNILAAQGYAILLASMAISPMGSASDPMLELPAQLIEAAENAVAAGYADPQRWAIMGHSYGGYGTAAVLAQTNRFKSGIALNGLYNVSMAWGVMNSSEKVLSPDTKIPHTVAWAEDGQGRMGSAPWADADRYIRNSPLFSADKITAPLLLIHGDLDGTAPVIQAEQMFTALAKQDKKVQFARYWGEGHGIAGPANIKDMWTRILTWLDETL